jgi:hypothetical protein
VKVRNVVLILGVVALTSAAHAEKQVAPAVPRNDQVARFLALNAAAPSASTQVPVAAVLNAYSVVLNSFTTEGSGNVDYWMKTCQDFARTAQALGRALQAVGAASGNGPVGAAISGAGGQLAGVTYAGEGNVDYWLARTKDIYNRARGTAQQLNILAQSLPAAGNPTMPLSVALGGFASVCTNFDYSGEGNVDYWLRTTENFANFGRALGSGVDYLAAGAPAPLGGVLASVASQLKGVSGAGNGNVDYWMARAQGVTQQIQAAGKSLLSVAQSL